MANQNSQPSQLDLRASSIVAIASGKGGVGKTTVAVNLAVVLAEKGARVGLMDADVYGPNCHIMLGLENMSPPRNKKMLPAERHGVKLISMGFLVKPGQPLVWRGPMLHSAVRQFVTDVEWGELDYLLVDLPPGTGDVQLSLAQIVPLTGGLIVTLPQTVSVSDARRGLEMFRQLNVPTLGVIENMSYMSMPDGSKMSVFGQGGGRKLALDSGSHFMGEIPLDPAVGVGSDSGEPIVSSAPSSPCATAIRSIAQSLEERVALQPSQQDGIIPIEVID